MSVNLTSRKAIINEAGLLTASATIDLYTLDATPIGGGTLYFYCGTNASRGPVVFQGITYNAFPVKVEGYQYNGKGEPPRPTVTFANVAGFMTSLVLTYDDLVGALFIRRRTFAKFLDGQPEADPNAAYPDDVYTIDRKVSENNQTVEFELGISIDVQGVMLPRRQVLANLCTVNYRGPECSFAENRVVSDNTGTTISSIQRFTGPWSAAASYLYQDGVLYDADGNERYYSLKVSSLAPSSVIPPNDSTHWTLAQWYRGLFSLSTTYQPNDVFYITRPGANYRRYFIVTSGTPVTGVQPPNDLFYTFDMCSKRLTNGCKLHFDPMSKNLQLPYGGFPGTNQNPINQ